jgi:hypothetical protein
VIQDLACKAEVPSPVEMQRLGAVERDAGNPDYTSLTDDVFRDFWILVARTTFSAWTVFDDQGRIRGTVPMPRAPVDTGY